VLTEPYPSTSQTYDVMSAVNDEAVCSSDLCSPLFQQQILDALEQHVCSVCRNVNVKCVNIKCGFIWRVTQLLYSIVCPNRNVFCLHLNMSDLLDAGFYMTRLLSCVREVLTK